jgi:hypothetical protein
MAVGSGVGYSMAAVEAAACSGPGSRMAESSGAKVEMEEYSRTACGGVQGDQGAETAAGGSF